MTCWGIQGIDVLNFQATRMHSSRMRTVRNSSRLLGGAWSRRGSAPRGPGLEGVPGPRRVSAPRGVAWSRGVPGPMGGA